MAKRSSILTHPDTLEKIANPGKVIFNAPFRIPSLPHPISCGYSTTSLRKLSASLRAPPVHIQRASGLDAARHAARPYPCGMAPGKKR